MKKKINNFLNNYSKWVPPKIFVLFILLVFTTFISFVFFKIDNDFWFLINTGRYILNNGFTIVEPFTIHTNLSFIVQQWLTDTIYYLIYNRFGINGMFTFVLISNIIIVVLIYKLSMLVSNKKIKISIIITMLITLILNLNFITTRPQIFDLILLLTELYLLESHIKSNKIIHLIGLPIISLLMINLHSAVWLMIFVLLVPYYVENLTKKSNKKYKLSPLLITTLIMLLLGIVNPYGFEAIKYFFNSYGISEINNMVGEMQPISIANGLIIFIMIFVVLTSYYYNKGNNKLRYFLLFIGTCYLGLSHYKGVMFFLICIIPSFSHNFQNIFSEKEKQLKFYNEKKVNITLIVMATIFLIVYGYKVCSTNFSKQHKPYLYNITNYLNNNVNKDSKIYTGYNDGGYLEYRGYKCYLDPRAEVFLKSNNKKEDILKEYYKLQTGKLNYKDFLSKYNFDYLIVSEEDILYYYIDNTQYEIVYEEEITHHIYGNKEVNYRIYKKGIIDDDKNIKTGI